MTKDELIEQHRDINVDWDDWWHYIAEDFIAKMKHKGIPIDIDDICYSGFCSQGDGAMFTCHIDGDDFDTFCKEHKLYDDDHILKLLVDFECDPYIVVNRNSFRCSHSNCTSVEFSRTYDFTGMCSSDIDDDDTRMIIMESFDDQYDLLFRDEPGSPSIEDGLASILRGYMDELYNKLYNEYYDLISDESVWESIKANGLDEELEEEDEAAA